jgi:hypothetical protein
VGHPNIGLSLAEISAETETWKDGLKHFHSSISLKKKSKKKKKIGEYPVFLNTLSTLIKKTYLGIEIHKQEAESLSINKVTRPTIITMESDPWM